MHFFTSWRFSSHRGWKQRLQMIDRTLEEHHYVWITGTVPQNVNLPVYYIDIFEICLMQVLTQYIFAGSLSVSLSGAGGLRPTSLLKPAASELSSPHVREAGAGKRDSQSGYGKKCFTGFPDKSNVWVSQYLVQASKHFDILLVV